MTTEELMQTLGAYKNRLQLDGFEPVKFTGDRHPTPSDRRRHASWMCLQAIGFAIEGRTDKANRWLGFIQCILWYEGFYTIDEMKEHNRSQKGGH